jgi:hypothetical protein
MAIFLTVKALPQPTPSLVSLALDDLSLPDKFLVDDLIGVLRPYKLDNGR